MSGSSGLEDAPGAQDYATVDLRGPLAIVVGSEGQGIRRLVRETCDILVKLPMRGAVTFAECSRGRLDCALRNVAPTCDQRIACLADRRGNGGSPMPPPPFGRSVIGQMPVDNTPR